jgi:hypothetical protein
MERNFCVFLFRIGIGKGLIGTVELEVRGNKENERKRERQNISLTKSQYSKMVRERKERKHKELYDCSRT